MYPQPSCSVSYTALVPLRKKREAEQINTDHHILNISFTSLPTWIKAQGGCGMEGWWGVGLHKCVNTNVWAHMLSFIRCFVIRMSKESDIREFSTLYSLYHLLQPLQLLCLGTKLHLSVPSSPIRSCAGSDNFYFCLVALCVFTFVIRHRKLVGSFMSLQKNSCSSKGLKSVS